VLEHALLNHGNDVPVTHCVLACLSTLAIKNGDCFADIVDKLSLVDANKTRIGRVGFLEWIMKAIAVHVAVENVVLAGLSALRNLTSQHGMSSFFLV
jgi:hypothetical protein